MFIWARKDMALYNELTFSTHFRPSEALHLKAVDCVAKMPGGSQHKLLDDVRAPFLDRVLAKHVPARLSKDGEDANLYTFSAMEYLALWKQAVETLQVPYPNRRGGAGRDHLLKLRSVGSTQRWGRWAVDAPACIHDKPGRLQKMVSKHGKWSEFGEMVCRNFEPCTGESKSNFCGKQFLSLFGRASELAKAIAEASGRSAVIDIPRRMPGMILDVFHRGIIFALLFRFSSSLA